MIASPRILGLVAALMAMLVCEAALSEDVNSDPLPPGVTARLGSPRFRVHGTKRGMAFASDDQTLVTAMDNSQIVLWDLSSGRRLREINTSPQWIQEMRLTPDRRAAITTGFELDPSGRKMLLTALIWDLKSGDLRQRVVREGTNDEAFDLTPDGRTLVFRMQHGTTMTTVDLETGFKSSNDEVPGSGTTALVVSPDGQLLAVADYKGLYLWSWQSEKPAEPIEIGRNRRIETLAFSPDGTMLLEGPENGRSEIVVRNVRSREVIRTLSNARKEAISVRTLAVSDDNKLLVAPVWNGKRCVVHVWNIADGTIVREIDTDGMSPARIALSHDAKWLAIGGIQSAIKIWNLQDGTAPTSRFEGHEAWIRSLHLGPEGRVAITTGADGTVRIWDGAVGRQRRILSNLTWPESAMSHDGRLIGILDRDDLRLCDTTAEGPLRQYPAGIEGARGRSLTVTFTPDGRRFLAWEDNCQFTEWDVGSGKLLSRRELGPAELRPLKPDKKRPPLLLRITAVFSSDAKRLAVIHGAILTVLETDGGDVVMQVNLDDGIPQALVFSPDGKRLAVSASGKA
ncbi:MAG: hypothetical protein ACM3U2_02205, partial [Deltaproteobacteria bacterium]